MPKLTKRFVDSLKPVGRDTLYRDKDLSGFALRAKPSGARTWVVQYRNSAGRTRKLALGRVGVLTPEEARRRAKIELGKVAGGQDPSAMRGAERDGMTVSRLCDEYLIAVDKGLVHGKRGRRKAPLTVASDKSRINGHIKPLLGTMLVKAVTRQDVIKFLEAVQIGKTAKRLKGKRRRGAALTGGPGVAARATGLLGGIFSYAIERGHRDDNPVSRVKKPADQRRTTFLTMDDYRALGGALQVAEQQAVDPRIIGAIRVLALTGCRKSEVTGLTLPEIDLDARQLRLSSTKEGDSLRPLGKPAVDQLRRLIDKLDRPEDATAIFVGKNGKAFSALHRGWSRIAQQARLEDVTLHTLRHSFATVANSMGLSDAAIAGLLGHARTSITARYAHNVDDVLLAAADRVAGAISRAMAGEKTASLHKIGDRRRA
jgi:integrase